MIPALVDGKLPPGVHAANREQTVEAFGWTTHRRLLLDGFHQGVIELWRAGCQAIWLDGSFVTDVEVPGDYDACWDPSGVALEELDPVLLDFNDGRMAQKAKYGGEFLPNILEEGSGLFFVDFFQMDRDGNAKGIISIDVEEWVT